MISMQRAIQPSKNATISVEKALSKRRYESKRQSQDTKGTGMFFNSETV